MAVQRVSATVAIILSVISVTYQGRLSDPDFLEQTKRGYRHYNMTFDSRLLARSHMTFFGLIMCGDSDCIRKSMKQDLIKCMDEEMRNFWFDCLDKTQRKAFYSDCDGDNMEKMLNCTLKAVDKNPLLVSRNIEDCYENIITIRAYRCSLYNYYRKFHNLRTRPQSGKIHQDGHENEVR
ncbi:hypothetical protein HDE_07873 [Halotydeus destructor]|nr:hypothetical protein HDE_07873 [Halotydeus destructor]